MESCLQLKRFKPVKVGSRVLSHLMGKLHKTYLYILLILEREMPQLLLNNMVTSFLPLSHTQDRPLGLRMTVCKCFHWP